MNIYNFEISTLEGSHVSCEIPWNSQRFLEAEKYWSAMLLGLKVSQAHASRYHSLHWRYTDYIWLLYVFWTRLSFSGFPEHVKIKTPNASMIIQMEWTKICTTYEYIVFDILYIRMEKSAETLSRMMFRPTTPWFHCCSFRPGPKCWMDLIESMSRPGPCWKMRWAQDGFPETRGAKELQSLWNQGSRWCCQRHLSRRFWHSHFVKDLTIFDTKTSEIHKILLRKKGHDADDRSW